MGSRRLEPFKIGSDDAAREFLKTNGINVPVADIRVFFEGLLVEGESHYRLTRDVKLSDGSARNSLMSPNTGRKVIRKQQAGDLNPLLRYFGIAQGWKDDELQEAAANRRKFVDRLRQILRDFNKAFWVPEFTVPASQALQSPYRAQFEQLLVQWRYTGVGEVLSAFASEPQLQELLGKIRRETSEYYRSVWSLVYLAIDQAKENSTLRWWRESDSGTDTFDDTYWSLPLEAAMTDPTPPLLTQRELRFVHVGPDTPTEELHLKYDFEWPNGHTASYPVARAQDYNQLQRANAWFMRSYLVWEQSPDVGVTKDLYTQCLSTAREIRKSINSIVDDAERTKWEKPVVVRSRYHEMLMIGGDLPYSYRL